MAIKLNLSAKGNFQEIILDYLEKNVSPVLAEKINTGTKTLKGCQEYIFAEAKKKADNSVACIEDSEVFGWAIHYFEEDAIAEKAKVQATPVEVKTSSAPKPAPKKTKETPKDDSLRSSLFDWLGGDES